mgnify:CR=1 FL=1
MSEIYDRISKKLKSENLTIVNSDLNRPWGGFFLIDEKGLENFANIYFSGLKIDEIKAGTKKASTASKMTTTVSSGSCIIPSCQTYEMFSEMNNVNNLWPQIIWPPSLGTGKYHMECPQDIYQTGVDENTVAGKHNKEANKTWKKLKMV